ncbi:unnamed protein product [Bathycoccus prasinos]
MRTTTMMPTSCLYRPLHHFSGRRRHKEQPQKRELLCWFSFTSRIVDRNRRRKWNSKRRTSSASSSSSSASVDDTRELHVLTFDLDDTVWPTLPVVTAANESYIKWLQTRVQNFPETRVMNELMKGIREEREEMFRMRGEEHVALSYASIRIAAAVKAMTTLCDVCEHDAIGMAARGYHLSWIPTRNSTGGKLLFPGVRECLETVRERYPRCVIGSITNGLGSASESGLREFFDFEISADELIDKEGVNGDVARKPSPWPFRRAQTMAQTFMLESGNANRASDDDVISSLKIGDHKLERAYWVHVGDDVLNDCKAAKVHLNCRTVLVRDVNVVKYVSGGGAPWAERPEAVEEAEKNKALYVDEEIVSVGDLPDILGKWFN